MAGSLDTERQAKLSRDDTLYSKVSNRRTLRAHGVMLGGASAGAGRGGHGGAGAQLDRGREGRRPRGGAGGSGPQVGGAAQVRSPSARPPARPRRSPSSQLARVTTVSPARSSRCGSSPSVQAWNRGLAEEGRGARLRPGGDVPSDLTFPAGRLCPSSRSCRGG